MVLRHDRMEHMQTTDTGASRVENRSQRVNLAGNSCQTLQDNNKSTRNKSSTVMSNMKPLTATHSGHFMTSNLDDDDDCVDGLGRGLGVDGIGVDDVVNNRNDMDIVCTTSPKTPGNGYNFDDACHTPPSRYEFGKPSFTGAIPAEFDSSLSKLFACMSIAYSGKLATPKFKAFKGLKINMWDKMRLNNIIWREWHLQFVRKHKPAVCSFSINMEDTHSKPQSVILEGKYWKRKLSIVCVEYKKWRVFYKKKIMPIQSLNEKGINELLDRVGTQDASAFIHNLPTHGFPDTSALDDDIQNMDFSDTLFSTLSQIGTNNQSSKLDFNGLGNSEFLQPNLVGLQPCLDDFASMDTIEPFQDGRDLLSRDFLEAFGWSQPSSTNAFGGSLNNISTGENRQGITAFAQPFTDSGSMPNLDNPQFSQPTPPPAYPSHTTLESQLLSLTEPTLSNVMPAQTILSTSTAPPNSVYTPIVAQQQPTEPAYVIVPSVTPVQQQSWTPVIATHLAPGIAVVPKEEFVKPKTSSRKPRTIAPRVTNAPNAKTTKQPSSFLAQLLTNGNGQQIRSNLNGQKPSSVSPKSPALVPQLVATSASLPNSWDRSSATIVQPSPDSQASPLSAEEFASPLKLSDSKDVHSTAEQKRRCHIKNGFDLLQQLVPTIANNANTKTSKAAMLTKTAEFAKKLKTERQQMQAEAEILQQEIEALNAAICSCQSQLPATGVPVTRQHSDQMNQMLENYIRERTLQNWKFYIFSQLAKPLFESFNTMVSTANVDELYRTTQSWLDQHCSLPALRPAVLSSLRNLGTQTSILSDPAKFPEQARQAVLDTKFDTTDGATRPS